MYREREKTLKNVLLISSKRKDTTKMKKEQDASKQNPCNKKRLLRGIQIASAQVRVFNIINHQGNTN